MPKESKYTEASFSPISLCLRVAQMPRSRDVVISMLMTTDNDRKKQLLYPLRMRVGKNNSDWTNVDMAFSLHTHSVCVIGGSGDMLHLENFGCLRAFLGEASDSEI